MLAEDLQVDLDQAQRLQKDWVQDLKREVSGHTAAVEEGDLVDALDSSKSWRAAKIVKKEERNVIVEFVGWEERWNEPIPLNGSRIKPFRTESTVDTSSAKGAYTGRIKTLLHETDQIMNTVSEVNFLESATAKDINLCLRGHFLFKLLEIQKIESKLDAESLLLVHVAVSLPQNVHLTFIKLLLQLIDSLKDNLMDYALAASKEKVAFLKHKPTAIVFAMVDFVYAFEYLIGCKEKKTRWKSIYEVRYDDPKVNDFTLRRDFERMFCSPGSKCPFNQISNIINMFCNGKGLEKLLSLLQWEKKCNIKEEQGSLHLPPAVTVAVLRITNASLHRMPSEIAAPITMKFIEALHNYFINFSQSFDVHYSEVDKLLLCFKFYEVIVQKVQGIEQFKIVDTEEGTLVMLLRYLSCPIFEKKFTAINMLNSRIEIYKKASDRDKEKYRNILQKNQILKILYISGYHPEIAKKSEEVLAFLAPKLQLATIKSLLTSAFEQSSEKGGVICLCLRKTLQALDIELIKSVLEILTKDIPQVRIENNTIQLIVEIIKQSGEKTNRFYFYKTSKEGTKVIEDSIQLLWNCLDVKNNLSSGCLKTVLEALEANIGKTKGGKLRMIELCINKLKSRTCLTQHVVLLSSMLESLDSKGNFMTGFTGSEYDKTLDKLYTQGNQGLATVVLEELLDESSKPEEDTKNPYNDEKSFMARINLILVLVFKGKQRPDSAKVFGGLMSHLVSSPDSGRRLDAFRQHLLSKDFVNTENSSIFFTVMNDLNLSDSISTGLAVYKLYEAVFVSVNIRAGSLDKSSNKKNLVIIVKQEKFVHLKQLWIFCLKSKITVSVKELFHKMLVECYFRGARKYESVEAQKAWTYFSNDVYDEMNAIRMNGDPRAKAVLLGNMANVWIKAIEVSSGALYIGGSKPSSETFNIFVKLPPSLGATSQQYILQGNCSLNMLKNTIIESVNLQEIEFNLLFNNRTLTYEHLETINLETASDFYLKNVPNKREGFDLELEVSIARDEKTSTAYSLRKKFTGGLPNNEYFREYFEIIDLDASDCIWKLFSMVPNNKLIRKEILSIPEAQSIRRYVDLSKPKKLLYYMNVLFKLLTSNREPDFVRKLCSSGQIDELINFVVLTENKEQKTTQTVHAIIKGVFPVLDFMIIKCSEIYCIDQSMQAEYFKAVQAILKFLLSDEQSNAHSSFIEKLVEDTLLHFENLIVKFTGLALDDPLVVDWAELYLQALVLNSDDVIKKLFFRTFLNCVLKKELREEAFIQILTPLYTRTLDKVYPLAEKAHYYFELASSIISNCDDEGRKCLLLSLLNFESIWKHLLPVILKTNDEALMVSILKFLPASLLGKPNLDEWEIENKEVLTKLISICLIDQTGKQRMKPVCQSPNSRGAFFDFMKTVTLCAPSTRSTVYSYFLKIINKGKWRRKYFKDWNIEIASSDTKLGQYAGLINLGATCYMNSIFQQVFMLEEFRNYLIDAEVQVDQTFADNVMFQFQMVMKGLRDAVRMSYNPRNFCKVFTNFDGSPINPGEQMDADEFFNNLMDKLETELKKSSQENVIKRTFGGALVQEIISFECDHKSTRESPFLTISLEVKNVSNITQSLERLVTGEILEGENKYNCESCQRKVKAMKRESIKKLPNKLIIVLKRFDYQFETQTKVKLNSYCEFPEKIDLSKYSQEYLNEETDGQKKASDYYNFSLRGVNIHRGTAEYGHYYAFIKEKNGQWYEFNDEIIREFKIEDLPEVAFGQDSSQESLMAKPTRGTNAYMLFYERDVLYDENDQPIDKLLEGIKTSKSSIQEFTTDRIMTENFEYYLKRVFFDTTYADFVIDKTEMVGHDQLYTSKNEEILHLAFSSFLILLVRKKHKERIPQMYTMLISVLKKSPEIAQWFLMNVSNEEFFQEFFIDCLVVDMKSFVYGLVSQAITTIMATQEQPVEITMVADSQMTNSDFLDLEPKDESSKEKPASAALQSVKNYLLLVLETLRKHSEKEKFLHYLYRLVCECSKYPSLNAMMSELKVPEHLLYLMHFKEAETHDKLDLEVKAVAYDSIFKGYIEVDPAERKMMSIEEINWEKKGEIKAKQDFKISFDWLVGTACRVLSDHHQDHVETCITIVKKNLWQVMISYCLLNENRYQVCRLVYEKTKDDVNDLLDLLKDLESSLISQTVENNSLKGGLYLIKFIVTRLDKDCSKKKTVKLLNLMVNLLDQVKLDSFDYVLSYLLRMMKNSSVFYEKFSIEGRDYLKDLKKRVDQYSAQIINSASRSTTIPLQRAKEIERLANLNKRRRTHQLALVIEQSYEAFKETIYYDSDDEFKVDADTKELDAREERNLWKKRRVRTNLGVMFELVSQGDKDKVWCRDDSVQVAPVGTATLEYQCKLDNL